MLELARDQTNISFSTNFSWPSAGGLVLGLVRSNEDLEAVQRLRYDVYTEELNAVFPGVMDGLDSDRYDPWCEHFMVKEIDTGRVVGTYRLLTPANARKAGGYYSEGEFDLSGLGGLYENLVEVGRSCTHPDYRNGSAIMLLWAGVAQLVHRSGFRHVLGCASVSLRDDGITAAQVWRLANKAKDMARATAPRVAPHHRYPVERIDNAIPARLPPLIKGYMKLGAAICGEPAWDPDFNTADFPVLLDVEQMDTRYRRHFGID